MSVAEVLDTGLTLWRTFGAASGARRVRFEVRRAAGRFRSDPTVVRESVLAAPLPRAWPFAVDPAAVAAATDRDTALARAERVLEGEHQAYRSSWLSRPRTPEEWSRHPQTRFAYDPHRPWFRVRLLDADAGDIKDVWEPARFGWVYDLLRGWMLTGDERFARAAWQGVESFLEGAQPFRGPQWACGQETAIRAIAWLWMEGALRGAAASTTPRLAALRRALAWSAERIEDALDYALSQRNNHALSEAVGLVAVGARFRGVEPRAGRWLRAGRRHLDRLTPRQIARDGWYIQHSFNYARVALDQLVIAERTLRAIGGGLDDEAVARVRALVRLLATVCEPESGRVPNHGANDGAYVLPLTTAPYGDYRSSLTAASATFAEPLPSDIAEDREVLAWLAAPSPSRRSAPAAPWVATGESGWVAGATAGARIFARAGEYRSRPAHVDPLHVDLWIDSRPVAVDAGTYRYLAPEPFRNGLAGIEVHNTLTIPASPPAARGPRFLWLRWPSARVRAAHVTREGDVLVRLENRSWRRMGVAHHRTCRLTAAGALVLDDVTAPPRRPLEVVLHWLLADAPDDVAIDADHELEERYACAEPAAIFGWRSEHYGAKEPAHSRRLFATVVGRLRIASGFGEWRDPVALRHVLEGAGTRDVSGEAPQWAGSSPP